MADKDRFLIAQIGRTVGLHGDLKLHLHTDFPEQFQKGRTFQSSKGDLTVAEVNPKRGTIRFEGYDNVDAAKVLTNVKLYADKAQTKEACVLKEGEYFWFDIIGCDIVEEEETLGVVDDIQRMAGTDYLLVQTAKSLVKEGLPNCFLIPYVPRYIANVDTESKRIRTVDTKAILEAS